MSAIRDFHGTPDDVADAVAARMQRKRLVESGTHRYIAILEEAVLRPVIGDAEVMAGQLGYLLEATTLPGLSLRVIPFGVTGRDGQPAASQPRGPEHARPTEARPEELRQAHDAADTLISDRFRSYPPGRMLPMLLGKFRDDVAESLGIDPPPLPRRRFGKEGHDTRSIPGPGEVNAR